MRSCLSALLSPFSPNKSSSRLGSDSTALLHAPNEKSCGIAIKSAEDEKSPADTSGERLSDLREKMKAAGIGYYVVATADAHGSEYVGECDKRRAWLSGFTGSAGTAIVSSSSAWLFTDSRYYVQAGRELNSAYWELMKVGLDKVPNWDAFLLSLPEGTKVGMDSSLIDYGTLTTLKEKILVKDAKIQLIFPKENLVDMIWKERPKPLANPIVLHPLDFAGQSSSSKLEALRKSLFAPATTKAKSYYLLSTLPSISYLLNLRGSDISYNPVFYSYLLLSSSPTSDNILFAQLSALSDSVKSYLKSISIEILEYTSIQSYLSTKITSDSTISFSRQLNVSLTLTLSPTSINLLPSPTFLDMAQAIKNDTEIQGFRNAYLRDGLAWVRWNAWLEDFLKGGGKISEWDAAEKLTEFRKEGEYFKGLAYENISATGENAALPHYDPSPTSSSIINLTSPYLNDSGAQYLDATIDTTRTVHFGTPTDFQRRAFTRVLQGHIAIDRLIFPEGTTGLDIDVLARRALWSEGMNYMHGAGHGIGEYLGVHEGPQGIGQSLFYGMIPLKPGMILSNEPGYYEAGEFGIRIESVLGVKVCESTRRNFGDKRWLKFERFTTVPIQSSFVNKKLMDKDELKWLREHNRLCREKLEPLLTKVGDRRALKWLGKQ